MATGIYTTNSPDACQYVSDVAQCQVMVVENDTQLQKILKVWDQLPSLKAIVQYTGTLNKEQENVYTVRLCIHPHVLHIMNILLFVMEFKCIFFVTSL